MKWKDVAKSGNIIGGEIETHENHYIYRGPISNIRIENGQVHIETLWTAWKSDRVSGGWTPWIENSRSFSADIQLEKAPDGRIFFRISSMSFGVIYPANWSNKLDQAKVKGLKISRS